MKNAKNITNINFYKNAAIQRVGRFDSAASQPEAFAVAVDQFLACKDAGSVEDLAHRYAASGSAGFRISFAGRNLSDPFALRAAGDWVGYFLSELVRCCAEDGGTIRRVKGREKTANERYAKLRHQALMAQQR